MQICAHPGCSVELPPRAYGQKGRTPKYCAAHRQRRAVRSSVAVPPAPRCEHGKIIGQCQMPECQPVVYLAGIVKGICANLRFGLETVRVERGEQRFFLEQIAQWEHAAERFGGGGE